MFFYIIVNIGAK